MSQPGSTNPLDDDHLVLTLIGIGLVPAAVAYAAATWTTTSKWLLNHRLLVPAQQHPLITLPGDVGLDLSRIVVVAAVVTAAVVLATATRRRRRRDQLL